MTRNLRIRAALCCLILILSASACRAQPEATQPETIVSATQATPTQEATEAPTPAPTEPPTEAPTRYVPDGVRSDPYDRYDASGFIRVEEVIPDVKLDIRYYTDHNFVGSRIDGYEEPTAILSKEAAAALQLVADDLREQGYLLLIYDAYRPQRAVDHFVRWAGDYGDIKMQEEFYPDLDKSVLFDYGYIASYSGHSRGSTVDLGLYSIADDAPVDMGGGFDLFSVVSHPDYTGVTDQQYANRMLLREAMISRGFTPLSTEWWHFTLSGEPYPATYFDFPVSSKSLQQ